MGKSRVDKRYVYRVSMRDTSAHAGPSQETAFWTATNIYVADEMRFAIAGVQESIGDLALDSSGGAVDTSDLCLWAVGISLTHPSTGELLNLSIEEPQLFEAVRLSEFEAWHCM